LPNLSPSQDPHNHHLSDTDKEMERDEWSVDIGNYRELGLAIANFNKMAGNDPFVGTATMSVEDGLRHLQIDLYYDENEKFRCHICNEIPGHPTMDNPGICTFCGVRVCGNCHRNHEQSHWRPQKDLAGNTMCDGVKVKCGRDQCPKCQGIPF
jgi:hypothetical protein